MNSTIVAIYHWVPSLISPACKGLCCWSSLCVSLKLALSRSPKVLNALVGCPGRQNSSPVGMWLGWLKVSICRPKWVECILGSCVHITEYMVGASKHYFSCIHDLLSMKSSVWPRLSHHILSPSFHSNLSMMYMNLNPIQTTVSSCFKSLSFNSLSHSCKCPHCTLLNSMKMTQCTFPSLQ